MSTTTDEQTPRGIVELMNLDTYQGMTDEEIETVINYKVSRALASAEFTAKMAANNLRMEQVIADNKASAQRALDMVESLLSREPPKLEMPVMVPTVERYKEV